MAARSTRPEGDVHGVRRPVRPVVVDDLPVVSVGIELERGIVARAVRALAGSAAILAARGERGGPEALGRRAGPSAALPRTPNAAT
ncbi:hypothetical protein WMF41_38950 [Sorangium sp. So ce1151]